jgi:thiamine-phosphate pyrophosphorylase
MRENFLKLMLLTNKSNLPIDPYLKFVEKCIDGGVTCVQLREKSLSKDEIIHFGKLLKELLDSKNVPLIINDDIDLCLEIKASGVHLGQSDGCIKKARSALPDKIIGLSVNTKKQVQDSKLESIDYIGIGAIFETSTKPDIENIWGLEGLKEASLIASHPIVAIGGINEKNAKAIMNSGASGIAAISVFHNSQDCFLTTQNLIKIIDEAKKND